MPQSLAYNYSHIIFSTKNRENFINDSIADELFTYIGGICKHLECFPVIIGGYSNHVHILCVISKKIALCNLIEKVKSSSSKWIKTKGTKYENFYWQSGYGSFSVGQTDIHIVEKYIKNQKNHHSIKSFKDEYLEFLEENKIKYDLRYLWD